MKQTDQNGHSDARIGQTLERLRKREADYATEWCGYGHDDDVREANADIRALLTHIATLQQKVNDMESFFREAASYAPSELRLNAEQLIRVMELHASQISGGGIWSRR